MRRGGQITEEQQKELRERAAHEEQARTLAGIDENLKPFLRSPGGDFRLELGGFVQFDFDGVQNNARLLTGPDLIDTFLVRRARLNMTGQLFDWIGFKIEGDYGTQQNPAVALTDGYIETPTSISSRACSWRSTAPSATRTFARARGAGRPPGPRTGSSSSRPSRRTATAIAGAPSWPGWSAPPR